MTTGVHTAALLRQWHGGLAVWILGLTLAVMPLGWAASPPIGTPIVNQARVSYADANGHPMPDATASVQTLVAGGPVLRVTKTASTDPVAPGATLTYSIRYENTGNAAATAVVVTDALAPYVIFQSATAGGTYTAGPPGGGSVRWDLGTLAAAGSGTLTITVRVKTPADYPPGDPDAIQLGTTIANTVTVTAAEGSSQHSIATTVGQAPKLTLVKTFLPGVVAPGSVTTVTLAYANTGNRPATLVQLRDTLPAGLAYVAGSASHGGQLVNGAVVWDLGTLAPGTAGTVSFGALLAGDALDGHVYHNTATVSCAELPAVTAAADLVATRQAVLLATKLDDPDPVFVGNPLYYTIRLQNGGNVPLTGIVVKDPVPAKTLFVSADAGGTLAGGEVVWTVAQLLPGEEKLLHLVVKVDPAKAAAGEQIQNNMMVTVNEFAKPSQGATTTIAERTPGQVGFYDQLWNQTQRYQLGSRVCLQVADPDQNQDPQRAESVAAVVTNSVTGDQEAVTLTETGLNTGIFRNCLDSGTGPGAAGNGTLELAVDSQLRVVYADALDLVPQVEDGALVDPFGKVFDAITGQPVKGAVVTIIDVATGQPATLPPGEPNTVTTGVDGAFAFPLVPPGNYRFAVVPGNDYRFPSAVPNAALPPGFTVGLGSRGEAFALAAGDLPLNLDVPVDPPVSGLRLKKTANRTEAAVGDIVHYQLTVSNDSAVDLTDVQAVDTLPHGLRYLKGSTKLDQVGAADPQLSGRVLRWSLGGVPAQSTRDVYYSVVVGPDSQRGDGRNTAVATGASRGRPGVSNIAVHRLKISGGVFADEGTILGKVFVDENDNGLHDEAEPGLAGVVLFLEDGTRVITDRDGKYSLVAVKPGTHVLRLDEKSLPAGLVLKPLNSRFQGAANSQFVDLRGGELFKANFAARRAPAVAAPAGGQAPSAPAPAVPAPPKALEDLARELTPELGFITPKDGATTARDQINVAVKFVHGGELTLLVNGVAVPAKRIGRRIANPPRQLAIYEYIGVELTPGRANRLTARLHDPFGNLRGEQEIVVQTIGRPQEVKLTLDRKEVPADGLSILAIKAVVLDQAGRIVTLVPTLTVDTSAGELREADADPVTQGHQVACQDGEASFGIRAPRAPGAAKVIVRYGELTAEAEVFFAPHLRELLFVGVGELTLGQRDTGGNFMGLANRDEFDDGLHLDGRGAFFVQGDLGKGFLLTAAYDSAKEESEEFYRQAQRQVDTEDKYPIYGDESRTDYAAMSRKKLYVRVDRERSYVLYGDYDTQLDETELAAYNRTLTGVRTEINQGKLKLKAFGAATDQFQVQDILPGKGISGFYYLSRREVVEGSTKVTIETRDRWRPDRVLARRAMSWGADYEVDHDLGYLLFREPIPSHDADLNPVYIIVHYESRDERATNYVYGGRAAYEVASFLTLGATGIAEEADAHNSQLLGVDATVKLPGNTTVRAEMVTTDTLFETDTGLAPQAGQGYLVELESRPAAGLTLKSYYHYLSEFYQNLSATNATRGTIKYGADLAYALRHGVTLKAGSFEERDQLNHGSFTSTSAGVERDDGCFRVGLELGRQVSHDDFAPSSGLTDRSPFDISDLTPDELTYAKLGFGAKLRRDLTLDASHQHDLLAGAYSLSTLGLGYQFDADTKAYVREEYGEFDDRTAMRTVLGAESAASPNTSGFNEYRLDGGAVGARNQQAIGLRNRFGLGPGVTGSATAEHQSTLSGSERPGDEDAVALTGALEVLSGDNRKVTTRLEHRRATSERSFLAEVGYAQRLDEDLTFLARERYFHNAFEAGGSRDTSRLTLGIAYRPADDDRFNGLAKFDYKTDRDTAADPGFSTQAYIWSLAGNYQLNRRTQLIGKYAGKLAEDDDDTAYTDLISARVIYDLTDRFDLGVEYRLLHSYATDTISHGGAIELGYRVKQNLWLSVGYSLDEFDTDLTGDGYHRREIFLRLRLKGSEELLRDLRHLAAD